MDATTQPDTEDDIAQYAIRLGDDALIHGQRLCEWSSQAPTLEEDLALSNVALDLLGRARLLYTYAGEHLNCSEDALAFSRDEPHFQNVLMVELPRGDFAFTMLRQLFIDLFEIRFFNALTYSQDKQLAAIAAKTLKEVEYHVRRSREWLPRLALGTPESKRRLQAAADELWGYINELFEVDALERRLIEQSIAPDRQNFYDDWLAEIQHLAIQCQLELPDSPWQVAGGRAGRHTEHFGHLLSELQFLQRAHPGAQW